MSNLKSPAARAIGDPSRLSLLSIASNVVFALVKGVAGILGNSNALIADAVESSLDVLSSIVVWSGLRIAVRPPDDDHPYGHGKAEPMAAAFVALMLIGAAFGIAWNSVTEIVSEEGAAAPAPFTLAVLVVAIAVKEGLYRIMSRRARRIGSTALMSDAWHHRSDAITSVAALLGISIAVIGGDAFAIADDIAALFACTIILFNGFNLLRPAINELMDSSPPPEFITDIREAARAIPGVEDIGVCLVRKTGFDHFVDLHVLVDGGMPVREGHAIAHAVEEAIMRRHPRVTNVLVHVEPANETANPRP